MREEGVHLPVIAKIEKPQAIDNLDEIVKAFDGFMVARGDLGVECPLEDVPFLQKQVIEKARRNAKPVIVATQMLESMITNPAPDPGRGLRRRQRGARRRRRGDAVRRDQRGGVPHRGGPRRWPGSSSRPRTTARRAMAAIDWQPRTRGGVIAKAAAEVAERVGARVPRRVHPVRRLRPAAVALPRPDPDPGVHARGQGALASSSLTWGVETFKTEPVEHTDEMVRQVDEQLLKIGRVKEGDLVVIIAGSPPGIPGSTNALRIHRMGDAINEVAPAYRRKPR